MLNIFKRKKNYFIGIDFGTAAIKVVELYVKDDKPHLSNYGWVDLGLSLDTDGKELKLLSFNDKLKAHLGNLLEEMGAKAENAYVSIPGFSGLITLLELPAMKKDELEKAIQFEAHKYIPINLSEVTLGWEIVSKKEKSILEKEDNKKDQKIQVLLVAAPKKEIGRYEDIVKGGKFAIKAIELETFSLVRSLLGNDLGNNLIIDIGARATNIILVEKGLIKANRNINVGGIEITNTISESMNISKQRAEMFKKGEKNLLNSKESSIIIPTLEFVANEALRIVNANKAKNASARIDSVILSGGSAKLKGISEYFSKILKINAVVGDPWRRIEIDDQVAAAVKQLGTSYTVAIGLALRGIDEYQRG